MSITERTTRAAFASRPARAAWYFATLACVSLAGCGLIRPRAVIAPLSVGQSLSVGEWSGTTSQGTPIRFTVSPTESVVAISVEYNFNGCSGTHTADDVSVPTTPDLHCIPGPCSGTLASYRAFAYSVGSDPGEPRMQINGIFLPGGRAQGQIGFFDYPACGSATGVTWTATRR
jgi:hypothetical protein